MIVETGLTHKGDRILLDVMADVDEKEAIKRGIEFNKTMKDVVVELEAIRSTLQEWYDKHVK